MEKITNFAAAQYKGCDDCFFAYFVDIGGLEEYYGHFEYDAKKQNIKMMRSFRN
jgi:hypothetical protein